MCEITEEPDWEKISGYKGAEEGYDDEVVELNPRAMRAICLLLQGKTQAEVAADIGVTQKTMSRWMQYGTVFKEILVRRQHDLWKTSKRKLMAMYMKSMNRLEDLICSDDEYISIKAIDMVFKNKEPQAKFDPDNPIFPFSSPMGHELYLTMKHSTPYYYKRPANCSARGAKISALFEEDCVFTNEYDEYRDASKWRPKTEILDEIRSWLSDNKIEWLSEHVDDISIYNDHRVCLMKLRSYREALPSTICIKRPKEHSTEFAHSDVIGEIFNKYNNGKMVYTPPDFWTEVCIPDLGDYRIVLSLLEELLDRTDDEKAIQDVPS